MAVVTAQTAQTAKRGTRVAQARRVAERDAEIRRLVVEQGVPTTQVARALKCSDETLRTALRRLGATPYRMAGRGRGWHPSPAPPAPGGFGPAGPSLGVPAAAVAAPPRPLLLPGRPGAPSPSAIETATPAIRMAGGPGQEPDANGLAAGQAQELHAKRLASGPGQEPTAKRLAAGQAQQLPAALPALREPTCCTVVKATLARHLAAITTSLVGGLEQQLAVLTGRPGTHPFSEAFAAQAQAQAREAVDAERGQALAVEQRLAGKRARASGAARKAALDARYALEAATRRHALETAASKAQSKRLLLAVEADLALHRQRCQELEARLRWMDLQLRQAREEQAQDRERQPDRAAQEQVHPDVRVLQAVRLSRPRLPVAPSPGASAPAASAASAAG